MLHSRKKYQARVSSEGVAYVATLDEYGAFAPYDGSLRFGEYETEEEAYEAAMREELEAAIAAGIEVLSARYHSALPVHSVEHQDQMVFDQIIALRAMKITGNASDVSLAKKRLKTLTLEYARAALGL